ncbi:MAG: hypothetical protein ACM33B_13630 [Pseudomonadota bacterium]
MADDHEHLVQPEPEVLEGEDDVPRQPVSDRDPFVPEPYARPGERREWRTMRLAVIVVLAVVAMIVVVALLR